MPGSSVYPGLPCVLLLDFQDCGREAIRSARSVTIYSFSYLNLTTTLLFCTATCLKHWHWEAVPYAIPNRLRTKHVLKDFTHQSQTNTHSPFCIF